MRRTAGRCPACGYDLRSGGVTHERCPECGSEVDVDDVHAPTHVVAPDQ
jgi:tRNA(Ile2) C34 agmatinyltransferase TiaS